MYIAFLPYLNAHANPRLTNDARNEIRVCSPPADFGPDGRVYVIHVRNVGNSRDMQFPASTYDNLCPWEFPRAGGVRFPSDRDETRASIVREKSTINRKYGLLARRVLSRGSITAARDNALRRGNHFIRCTRRLHHKSSKRERFTPVAVSGDKDEALF